MLRKGLFVLLTAAVVAVCVLLGDYGARALERLLIDRTEHGLEVLDLDWAYMHADGLRLELHGHAPDIFARDLALESARSTAPLAVIVDYTTATLAPPPHRPSLRIELLRDANGLTLTGRFYGEPMRASLIAALSTAAPGLTVNDLTGVNAARPDPWGPELEIATLAATRVGNAYVVVEPGAVQVGGLVRDAADRREVSAALLGLAGGEVRLELDLREPLQVAAPFAFAVAKEATGPIRLEACAGRDMDEAAALEAALKRHGADPGEVHCQAALGGPSGDWAGAVAAGLQALDRLAAGRFRLEYHVAELSPMPEVPAGEIGAARAELAAALPEDYRLRPLSAAERPETAEPEPYWMRLRWTGEMIEVSGLAADATTRRLIESYAAATFGRASLRPALALGGRGVPADWDLAALAALDALGAAATGGAELAPGRIALSGTTAGGAEAGRLHRTLAEAAPEGYAVTTALTVDLPAAVAAVPLTPARCARALNDAVLVQPIGFDPGSAVFESGSGDKLDRLASILRRCTPAPIEIGGHTDSQGSTDLNQRLSRARAEAVLDALLARGVRLDNMRARGYGESQPVASNDTEAGRALNRRIAFRAPEEAD